MMELSYHWPDLKCKKTKNRGSFLHSYTIIRSTKGSVGWKG